MIQLCFLCLFRAFITQKKIIQTCFHDFFSIFVDFWGWKKWKNTQKSSKMAFLIFFGAENRRKSLETPPRVIGNSFQVFFIFWKIHTFFRFSYTVRSEKNMTTVPIFDFFLFHDARNMNRWLFENSPKINSAVKIK